MAYQLPQLLIEELQRQKLLSPEVVNDAEKEAAENQKDFGEILIKKNLISDPELLKIKSRIYQLPVTDISGVEIDREVVKDIPENIISYYKILPFARDNSVLKVGIIDPENINALEAVKFIAFDRGLNLEKYLISYKDFDNLSKNVRTLTSEVGRALEQLTEEATQKELKISEKTGGLEEITAEAPVTRIVAIVVKHAVETRASDIHIEPFEDKIRLRFRIDGVLRTVLSLPIRLLSAIVTRIKILSDLKIDETRLAQDGRFSTKVGERRVDFRVSTFPTRNGEKVVLRILDPLVGDIKLTELGLEGRSLELIRENMVKPFGEILITGPTGSGKSTTLAAVLREINDEEVNIVTLEDPIEYFVDGVNQSQTHEEIGYTFANGLRHILRQDPDIIMVGEIRDSETAGLATQAALTGHVVLSTLHTNDTIGAIPRLIDMNVEKYLLAPTLNLVVAQRLARRLCQVCKVKERANQGEEFMIRQAIEKMPSVTKKDLPNGNFEIYKPGSEGCKECGGRAYKGRVGVFETLAMTDELEKIILTNISEEELRAEAKRQGMITMFQDGIIKVLNGVTSLEELLTVAQEAEEN
ncbi:MAG: type II/IV secretion system protein [Candidatus Yanofskybacteria bacterium]|nr:type II/IV secretion system protein [Candidatus Yanofskybacteria bacterium]